MPTTHPEQEVTESMTIHVFGSTAVATGIYVAKGVENGKPYLRRGRFIDTWALKNGTLVVRSQPGYAFHTLSARFDLSKFSRRREERAECGN